MEVIAALCEEGGRDGDLAVQCALLHDVIEDTPVPFQAVAEAFGGAVADGVLALSKNASLPKDRQMADSLQRIRQQPPEVWMVKMADRISNLQAPPSYWTPDKIRQYRAEAVEILGALEEASAFLASRLRGKIAAHEAYA
jgi:(p)ppGpp synthase/HD superfamily hydrolase